jgi:hypothetical protein
MADSSLSRRHQPSWPHQTQTQPSAVILTPPETLLDPLRDASTAA